MNSVEVANSQTHQWKEVAPLKKALAHLLAVSFHGESLYVFGGYKEDVLSLATQKYEQIH
jgi:hypothetical protein